MKILHITHSYFPEGTGGTETHVRELLAEQQRQGLEVTLLTGSIEPHGQCEVEEFDIDGVHVLRLHRDDWFSDLHSKAYHPGVERLVRALLATQRPDLVHVHHWLRLTSNLLEICDDLDIPAVLTLHDLYTSCPRAFRVRADGEPCFRELSVPSCRDCVPRYGHESDFEIAEGIRLHQEQLQSELARARAMVVASAATGEMICSKSGFDSSKITVLALPFTPRLAAGAPRRTALPTGGEPFRFGYWGNVTARKGVQVLLQATRQITERGAPRPFEVHVFGSVDTDELRARLDALAEDRPVVFHGRYDYDQLAAAGLHMAVFPIICFETFGFVLDEAVELGLPCILTDIGAMPERAGAAARVVPPKDASALASAMTAVLEQPEIRDQLAAHLPPLPAGTADYAARLRAIYKAAVTAPPLAQVRPVDPLRRAAFAVTQRETALRREPRIQPQ